MYRNKTARQHNFALVPGAEIPRSKMKLRQTRKQAFDASDLIPIMCEEVLPGDVWQHTESILARLATPIAPVVDDLDLETFYFFVPNRITFEDWEDLITGANDAVTVPKAIPTDPVAANFSVVLGGVLDHFGLPQQTNTTSAYRVNALPIFAYFMIWNEWFRDQNLQAEWEWPTTPTLNTEAIEQQNTPVLAWDQLPLRVNKRHDYFTSSLPFAQKGTPVSISLGTTAPVVIDPSIATGNSVAFQVDGTTTNRQVITAALGLGTTWGTLSAPGATNLIYTDLSTATATTINAIRLAFQTQKLLERDARGGSRYIEQLLSQFNVRSPDFRLQRPEYLGGSKIPVTVNPIAQTAAYDAEPSPSDPSALGNLGAEMHASGSKRTFTYSAVEHGYIIGLACARATPTYQQGTRRHWLRDTRLDFYFPVFSHLGEQAVQTVEIFTPTNNTPSLPTWGYQERSAEYRYTPNEITGVLRSTAPQPLDWWHYAEEFVGEPALNDEFIQDKTKETLARSLATAPSAQWSAQIIMDVMHDSNVARLMPAYAAPGLIDHF